MDLSSNYAGRVKLRMVHRPGATILLVDLIAVDGPPTYWLQPHWVSPPVLDLSPGGVTTLFATVARTRLIDATIRISFTADELVTTLPDQSQVYRCRIAGPNKLRRHEAGRCRVRGDGGVDLRLFHHTTTSGKKGIKQSEAVWGSRWNFQGTRELINVSYAYLTSLPKIATESDLNRVAMSQHGRIPLRLDTSPTTAGPDLALDVLRRDPTDRGTHLSFWVPAEVIAPSHVYLHTTDRVEYEMAHPWIFRVGLTPGGSMTFDGDVVDRNQRDSKSFDHVIIGDCSSIDGLRAPYDEEDTTATFALEDLGSLTVMDFWREQGNRPLFKPPADVRQLDQGSSDFD